MINESQIKKIMSDIWCCECAEHEFGQLCMNNMVIWHDTKIWGYSLLLKKIYHQNDHKFSQELLFLCFLPFCLMHELGQWYILHCIHLKPQNQIITIKYWAIALLHTKNWIEIEYQPKSAFRYYIKHSRL